MIKLQLVQLDRDIEWPGLGISGSLLRAEDKWDLQRDEAFTYVSAKRAGQISGGGLIPAARCMFVVDAVAEPAPTINPVPADMQASPEVAALLATQGTLATLEAADADALIDARAAKQRARANASRPGPA